MSEKFKGKYRNESTRWQNWDYGSNAAYFITICTKDRKHYFGEVENDEMRVSPAGAIAHVLWHEIKNHAKNIELGEFAVMPNHIHGIIIIDNPLSPAVAVRTGHALSQQALSQHALSQEALSQRKSIGQLRFQNPGKNTISSICGSYKSAVTKYCNQLKLQMGWHPRFHDHVIRNDESFQRISEYIRNNPKNWKEDKFN